MRSVVSLGTLGSPARKRASTGPIVRVAAVQQAWHPDEATHVAGLRAGAEEAARLGADLVCFQELTLSPYFASRKPQEQDVDVVPEQLAAGPTFGLARELATELGVHIHASLYEAADAGGADKGFNTAIVVGPDGELLVRTRKLHLPVTAGYYEDQYFDPGPPAEDAFQTVSIGGAVFGFPTCWDQWFPELARIYALRGADVLVYPTAIGSEPEHPEFDTQPLWKNVITGHGITNGLFMVAVNRIGDEGEITFYGGSFVSDPYGRVIVEASRTDATVLVADLDIGQRRDWLELFPFMGTRRPDTYAELTSAVQPEQRPTRDAAG